MSYHSRLTRENAALLIVDHQVGLFTGVRDIDTLTLKHNIVGLAKATAALKVPIVVTTTTEGLWGPMIPELQEALPVVAAVEATGRKNLIITGISTDVCLALPALSALAAGYTTYAAIDASGAFTKQQADAGVMRMVQAGVVPVCYSNVIVEILADNAAAEANAVYAALDMPFAGLVGGLNQYFSNKN
ncbi:unnamed protein product [Clonostachys byssicola]|uniref:Isochorismatase-like domain-containing protein n=1 Tax=Clonostachys byssicola TaxID=160290 RepID=A0A9N9YA63_9HYPO|nr:unnamed protein product [Clonostachys byssicola]